VPSNAVGLTAIFRSRASIRAVNDLVSHVLLTRAIRQIREPVVRRDAVQMSGLQATRHRSEERLCDKPVDLVGRLTTVFSQVYKDVAIALCT